MATDRRNRPARVPWRESRDGVPHVFVKEPFAASTHQHDDSDADAARFGRAHRIQHVLSRGRLAQPLQQRIRTALQADEDLPQVELPHRGELFRSDPHADKRIEEGRDPGESRQRALPPVGCDGRLSGGGNSQAPCTMRRISSRHGRGPVSALACPRKIFRRKANERP